MKSAVAFRILYQPIPFFVSLPTVFHIVICLFGKIVLIDKIISRVIRWININHLHFSKIGFPQDFQGVEVIAFDVDIFAIDVPPCVPSRLTDFSLSSLNVFAMG